MENFYRKTFHFIYKICYNYINKAADKISRSEVNLKKNYSLETDRLLSEKDMPTVLLHCCCAPCSSTVLERIADKAKVTVFFFNPNISPADEYEKRLTELKRLISEMKPENPIELLETEYDPQEFFNAVKGLENIPEGGERCRKCFELRLGRTAKEAAAHRFDLFATTLTISPLKNAEVLNEVGEEKAKEAGAEWLPSDFKKKDGYKRSVELSAKYELYRQDYCGCVFSKREAEERKKRLEKAYNGQGENP